MDVVDRDASPTDAQRLAADARRERPTFLVLAAAVSLCAIGGAIDAFSPHYRQWLHNSSSSLGIACVIAGLILGVTLGSPRTALVGGLGVLPGILSVGWEGLHDSATECGRLFRPQWVDASMTDTCHALLRGQLTPFIFLFAFGAGMALLGAVFSSRLVRGT